MKSAQPKSKRPLCIFMGPPGAGKGSLSRLLRDHCGWSVLSTGDQLRFHVSKGTDLGKQIDFLLHSGILIPDDLVLEVVRRWLREQSNGKFGVILDGFPRTLHQAKAFSQMIHQEFSVFTPMVVQMTVPDEVVKRRIAGRLTCSNVECQAVYSGASGDVKICERCGAAVVRRCDDERVDIIERRLRAYHEHSADIIDFLAEQDVEVVAVDAGKALQYVFEDLKTLIGISVHDSC